MPQDGNQLLGIHEKLTALTQEVADIKGEQNKSEKRVDKLETRIEWNEREVKGIKDDIKDIRDDTKWLRRTITTTIIGTLSTGVIGGAIALIWTFIGK